MAEETKEIIPNVLVVSCGKTHPREIVELILGKIPEEKEIEKDVFSYPWHLSTRYYEVDVNLCTLLKKSIISETFAESVQAVVLYFNSECASGLEEANSWLPFLKEFCAEIQILLCHSCKEGHMEGISELSAQEWCIREGFELVELDPKSGETEDEMEIVGIERVRKALEAHVWPNLILKEVKEPVHMSELLSGGRCKSEDVDSDQEVDKLLTEGVSNFSGIAMMEELLSQERDVDFTDLFSELMSMKERASTMQGDMRKDFAERVVHAYWKAIGGDDEEVSSD